MFFFCPYVGNTCEYLILPIDELIFFRGVAQPPTSKVEGINPYKSPSRKSCRNFVRRLVFCMDGNSPLSFSDVICVTGALLDVGI